MQFRFLLFTLLCLPFFPASAQQVFKLKNGDLLFQDLDCGDMCEAIESVTTGYKNADFSHVGIVKIQPNGEVLVLEAIGPDVHYTPLEKFLNRQLDTDKKPKVAVGRLRKPYQKLVPKALTEGEKLLKKPYDDVFALNNDAYYCSELVYEIFKSANNQQEIFPLFPMTYATPGTNEIMPLWIAYFEKLNARVPQNDLGLNPGGISCSKKLKMYFPYGQPAKRKKVLKS
ncbi:hypothetical protein I5M27_07830 [Adhaeribacter sp. BT258]|uniref:Permuted papain-like amidase enzyme, YaeF/YiiX, C92 family n=1 Tax=Adhaeribacter terrigena TaxID=2793070 RepID=A0ABS1C143_9BACT|nr:YiiX/YebB-like N1pC/P60 family cysteine hydrolase [Adhaeribacter terrigena]MBK0402892.1 hypothetical protein [Adhaeribacter terrigena]